MPTPNRTKVSYLRVRADVHAAVTKLAAKSGLSFGEVIDQIVRDHLGLPYPEPDRIANVLKDGNTTAA